MVPAVAPGVVRVTETVREEAGMAAAVNTSGAENNTGIDK